nr:peptidoglycan editing factor PgeF [Limnohabitans sp. Jir72]
MILKPDFPSSWLRPQWPAPTHVRAVVTDRHGGVSEQPYDSMNLGDHVGDFPANVLSNRARLQAAVGCRPVFLHQVHGVECLVIDESTPDNEQADASMSGVAGVACTIMVADCLPVLLCDAGGRWVAAAHAGWRGLAGRSGLGVLEKLLASCLPLHNSGSDILVWLGPCIGPLAFEVGPEVRAAFCDGDSQAQSLFQPVGQGKFLADLAGLARLRLQRLGIERIFGNDSQPAWCTATQTSRFFSHRRDSRVLGHSGRMAACIWLEQ